MLHVIVFSLAPLFFVLGLGFYAGHWHRVDNRHIESLNALVMRFALPCSLFVTTANASLSLLREQASLFVFLVLSMLLLFFVSYQLQRRLWRQATSEAAVQACTVALPNYASAGIPLLSAVISPAESLAVAVAVISGSVVISPLTLILLGASDGGGARRPGHALAQAVLSALRNPVVIAPVLGTCVTWVGWRLPDYVASSFSLLGMSVGGVALFVTGLLISAQPFKFSTNMLVSVLMKNILHPLLIVGMVYLFPLPREVAHALILLAAIPSGFFGILFGVNKNVPYAIPGATLLCSTVMSIPTLALAIYLLPHL